MTIVTPEQALTKIKQLIQNHKNEACHSLINGGNAGALKSAHLASELEGIMPIIKEHGDRSTID